MPDPAPAASALIGGVGDLWQGDLDLGRLAAEQLAREDLGPGVAVEDLCYGAIIVAHRLDELRPEALVLVGAAERGRPPGTVARRRVDPPRLPVLEAQAAMWQAGTGYISIDLVVEVGAALGVLPGRTVMIDVEPATTEPCDRLSPAAEDALPRALELVRAEVRRLLDASPQPAGREPRADSTAGQPSVRRADRSVR